MHFKTNEILKKYSEFDKILTKAFSLIWRYIL